MSSFREPTESDLHTSCVDGLKNCTGQRVKVLKDGGTTDVNLPKSSPLAATRFVPRSFSSRFLRTPPPLLNIRENPHFKGRNDSFSNAPNVDSLSLYLYVFDVYLNPPEIILFGRSLLSPHPSVALRVPWTRSLTSFILLKGIKGPSWVRFSGAPKKLEGIRITQGVTQEWQADRIDQLDWTTPEISPSLTPDKTIVTDSSKMRDYDRLPPPPVTPGQSHSFTWRKP